MPNRLSIIVLFLRLEHILSMLNLKLEYFPPRSSQSKPTCKRSNRAREPVGVMVVATAAIELCLVVVALAVEPIVRRECQASDQAP